MSELDASAGDVAAMAAEGLEAAWVGGGERSSGVVWKVWMVWMDGQRNGVTAR